MQPSQVCYAWFSIINYQLKLLSDDIPVCNYICWFEHESIPKNIIVKMPMSLPISKIILLLVLKFFSLISFVYLVFSITIDRRLFIFENFTNHLRWLVQESIIHSESSTKIIVICIDSLPNASHVSPICSFYLFTCFL